MILDVYRGRKTTTQQQQQQQQSFVSYRPVYAKIEAKYCIKYVKLAFKIKFET